MTIIKNEDHVQRSLDNRINQFQDSSNLEGLITIYVNEIQDLENAIIQILEDTLIDTAVGINLDHIGDIVGEERQTRSDDQYRPAIKTRIKLNLSNGTHENIIELIKAIAGESLSVRIIERYPAAFEALIDDPIIISETNFDKILLYVKSGKPVSVKGFLVFYTENPFQYDSGLGYDQGHYGGALEV